MHYTLLSTNSREFFKSKEAERKAKEAADVKAKEAAEQAKRDAEEAEELARKKKDDEVCK